MHIYRAQHVKSPIFGTRVGRNFERRDAHRTTVRRVSPNALNNGVVSGRVHHPSIFVSGQLSQTLSLVGNNYQMNGGAHVV
jgi:hypothetical protein